MGSLEYNISYLSILDSDLIEEIKNSIINKKSLNEIYFSYTNSSDIPIREKINLFTVGNRALREQLFSKQWNRGDILGPIVTDDNVIMFVQIDEPSKFVKKLQTIIEEYKKNSTG